MIDPSHGQVDNGILKFVVFMIFLGALSVSPIIALLSWPVIPGLKNRENRFR